MSAIVPKVLNLRGTQALSPTDRRRFGRVLWLFGDSIFRGHALGKFADAIAGEHADKDPLWPFRSPSAMINLFLSDSDSLSFDTAGAPIEGHHVASLGGLTGLPTLAKEGVINLERAAEDGSIQHGDTLAFLDAGHHFGNPDRHQTAWKAIARAASATGERSYFCTVFDDLAEHQSTTVGRVPKERYMHDVKWDGGRSHNDALRAAVAEQGIPGVRYLLETSATIQHWNRRLQSEYGVSAYLPDKIHLNVWGQMRLSWVLFSAAWPDLAARTVPRSTEILSRAMWERLRYRTTHPAWSGKTAVEIVRLCTSLAIESVEVTTANVA